MPISRLVAAARGSRGFLTPWEPIWSADHLTRKAFTNRVYWAQRATCAGHGAAAFADPARGCRRCWGRSRSTISGVGRRRPATLGYWIGQPHARQGLHARGDPWRWSIMPSPRWISAGSRPPACPKTRRRAGCWKNRGFKYEGVAQSYLQINGRWRNHVLYANLRGDRRGRTDVGLIHGGRDLPAQRDVARNAPNPSGSTEVPDDAESQC